MATKKQIEETWEKAKKIRGQNPNLWKRDDLGNKMYKPAHGKGGRFGWSVDHIKPKSKGGGDSLSNLRALNTTANLKKGNKRRA